MRIIDLALKDLTQMLRDKRAALFLIIMPIVFTLFMGFAFKPASSNADPRLPIGFSNNDGSSLLSTELKKMLEDSAVIRLEIIAPTDAATLNDRVRSGQLTAAITIPASFSDQLLANQPIKLTVLADNNTSTGQAAASAIQTTLTRLFSVAKIANLARSSIGVTPGSSVGTAIQQASQAWRDPSITIAVESAAQNTQAASAYTQMSPGMIVQFAIFGLITSSMILVLERKTRTLQRLMTTSLSRTSIIAGHLLAMFVVVLVQEIILVAFGQIALGVNYLREPIATSLVMIALAIWSASLGLLISTFAKEEQQVVLYSLIAMFLFTALGGAWFPLDMTGQTFSIIGHLTPGAWAMDGFQNIIVRGLAFESVLLPVGILIAYAILFFGLGVWRFKTE
jgi:ABC-2 type transport system permease protein